MSAPPSLVRAIVAVAGAARLEALLALIAAALPAGSAQSWRLGDEGEAMAWPPTAEQLAGVAANAGALGVGIDGDDGRLDLYRVGSANGFPDVLWPVAIPAWRLDWTSPDLSADGDYERLRRTRDTAVRLVRGLVDGGAPVEAAMVLRQASSFAPSPPQAPADALLFVADRLRLRRQYADPATYWRAWDDAREVGGGRVLVTRALAIDDEAGFKAAVYPRTWDLARGARPGLTRFGAPEVDAAERTLFEAGEPTLTQLGFDEANHRLEYTAYLGEGAHVLPCEIYRLRGLLVGGKLADGSRLDAICVAFPDEAVARREFTPLHDVGVEVAYLSAPGQWETMSP